MKKEKEQLLAKVEDLEEQLRILLQANDMHTLELTKEHQEHIYALNTALEVAREEQIDLQPLKQHVLTQKTKMLQL